MKVKTYYVNAFTDNIFAGNPAAVCPLDTWLDDNIMQKLACNNNLSETAFFVSSTEGCFDLRWFTPTKEVDLCGHATLASAFIIFNYTLPQLNSVQFNTRGGPLSVAKKENGLIEMNFPAYQPQPVDDPGTLEILTKALGVKPAAVLATIDYLVVLDSEDDVLSIKPDFRILATLDKRGVIVTAPGKPGSNTDFVSRMFAPNYGIDEDPVTGSAHCTLTPYWAGQLKRTSLRARQLSSRGGQLYCTLTEDSRTLIAGTATLYMEATVVLP